MLAFFFVSPPVVNLAHAQEPLPSAALDYDYDVPASVVGSAPDEPSTATTPTANTRSDASAARPSPRTSPEVIRLVSGCCVAAKAGRGGAGPVRVGQAGEDAVRGAYNIGDKTPIGVNGRGRVPDGLTPTTLSEVKNVGSLSYTKQLRDYVDYAARQPGMSVDLYVRRSTTLSGPLADAIAAGKITRKYIP